MEKLIGALLEARGELSLTGFFLTADRGYGNFAMVPGLARKGIGFIFIMPAHLLRCHPFVGMSHFIAKRNELEEENEVLCSDEEGMGVGENIRLYAAIHDRDSCFIIDDSPGIGPLSKYADKSFKYQQSTARQTVTAVVIRERGTNKFSKILRFAYCLPDGLSSLFHAVCLREIYYSANNPTSEG